MKKKQSFLALCLSLCALVTVMAGTSTKTAVHEPPGPKGIQSNLMAVYELPEPQVGIQVADLMGPGPKSVKMVEPTMLAVIETPGPHGIVAYEG